MAARMSQQSPLRKEQLLDVLKDNFVVSINTYVSATKAAMRAEKPETAAEIFQSAVAFISQEIPDPTCQASDRQTRDDERDMEEELKAVTERVNALEKQIQEEKVEVRKNCSSLELKLSTSSDSMRIKILHLNRKFDSLKNDLQALDSETRESLKELTEISKENSNALKGLRKFQSLFKEKTQAAAKAVTPPPTAASAAAIARPLKDVRQSTYFSVAMTADQRAPYIEDAKLLPGGRLVLADSNNICMKLFNTQGQHLHTLKCETNPIRLAVIDSSETSSCYTLAVTLNFNRSIAILEVVNNQMMVKRTLQTSRQYCAVAAVNKTTLAMGYVSDPGIDLIDMAGQVLRQICSSVRPHFMDVTEDGEIICSTINNRIARVQVDSGTVDFNQSVPQIICPCGVAIAPAGSILVADAPTTTLHLVSSLGVWTKQLWSVPSGRDQQGALYAISMDMNVCVYITHNGSVYLLDCVY